MAAELRILFCPNLGERNIYIQFLTPASVPIRTRLSHPFSIS